MIVDLERCLVARPDGQTVSFDVSPEWRMALLEGLDESSVIVRMEAGIDALQRADAKRRP